MKRTIFALALTISLCGCSTIHDVMYPKIEQEPPRSREKRTITRPIYKAIGTKDLAFHNRDLSVSYTPDMLTASVGMVIRNKSSSPIKIIWDETVFINGSLSESVVPEGTRLISSDESKPPMTIAPNSMAVSSIVPKSSISYRRGWEVDPICGSKEFRSEFKDGKYISIPKDAECVGHTFGVLITYEIDGKKKMASFKFKHVGHEEVEEQPES